MKKILKLKRIYFLCLLPISFALILLARRSSSFVEQVFSLRIYKWLSQIISSITGLFPFSIAEIIIILLPFACLIMLCRFIIHIIRDKANRKEIALKGLLNLLCGLSLTLFMFVMLAGMNYYRYSFTHYSGLEIRNSTVDELYALTESLVKQANEYREKVPATDENGVFRLSVSKYKAARIADKAMDRISEEYGVLKGAYAAPKPVVLSPIMSYTEITGIFFPFTMEANVNVHVPDYSIPATMLHELAHLRGFMREDEANYIAYIAGMASDNVEFNYSATMLALISSGNALYRQDRDLYSTLREQYSEKVDLDLRANSAYWAKYEDTVVSTVSNKVNDTYLKANAQADGVKSYSRMVDLLLAKYRKDQDTAKDIEK
jgi:type IV secretory pathway VirB2 component (pilin)